MVEQRKCHLLQSFTNSTELLFGMRVDASSKESNIIRKLNFTFLYAKYYLYNQKLIHGELSVNEFIVNLTHKLIFSKNLSCRSNDVNRNVRHWLLSQQLYNYMILVICLVGGAVASWLVCSTPERAVRVRALAGDIVLCPWARHFTLTVPLSTQVYKWVPANLMLGGNPVMD